MTTPDRKRTDEVGKYYKAAATIGKLRSFLFWVVVASSLFMPYSISVIGPVWANIVQSLFIIVVLLHFALSQISLFHLIPRAERQRRKQLLTNALGAVLSHDKTALYYNNQYAHSIPRLGANVMENALFSKEIAAKMLQSRRIIVGVYIATWIFLFALRHDHIELLTWITQVVFSGEIIVAWLRLEVLRFRQERTFEQLHYHFRHQPGNDSPEAIADLLDAFAEYEAAKSSSGLLLSGKVFSELNPALTAKWEQIQQDLKMIPPQTDENGP